MESIAAERLNKIGKNPSLVSKREDLQTDLRAVNELLTMSTLSAETLSDDSESKDTLMVKKGLPRPRSETCFKFPLRDHSSNCKFDLTIPRSETFGQENPTKRTNSTTNLHP